MDVATRKAEQGMAGVRPSAFSSGKHSGSKRAGQLWVEEMYVCVDSAQPQGTTKGRKLQSMDCCATRPGILPKLCINQCSLSCSRVQEAR